MEVVADPLVTILGISSQNPKPTENSNQMVDSQQRESQRPGQDEIEKPMQATQETPLSQEHEGQEPGQEEIEKSEQNQRKPLQEQTTEFEQPTEIQTADQATLGSKQATVVKAKAEAEAEAAAKAE